MMSGPAMVTHDLRCNSFLGKSIGVTMNSGNESASACAPASFVRLEIPTKNSRPVKRTSPPSSVALTLVTSRVGKRRSRLRMQRTLSTYRVRRMSEMNKNV